MRRIKSILILIGICLAGIEAKSQCTPSTTTNGGFTIVTFTGGGTCTWTAPAGVTSIKVECWGAGGAGQYISVYNRAGGGGGGGAYSRGNTITVAGGQTYTLNIGTGGSGANGGNKNGGETWFSLTGVAPTVLTEGILAKGGTGGSQPGGGAGGTTAGFGDIKYAGGAGGSGNNSGGTSTWTAGGGGSSAGNGSIGNAGVSNIGGAAPTGGGKGASVGFGYLGDGFKGGAPGGGGSGCLTFSIMGTNYGPYNGGNGADGQVAITYISPSCATPTLTVQANSANPLNISAGDNVVFNTSLAGGGTCSSWEYAWSNDGGVNYWNGSTFSGGANYNSTYNSISVANVTATGTYTVYVRCSDNPTGCKQTGTVLVRTHSFIKTVAGDYTWTAPCGVTEITVECWGAGGGGQGSRNLYASGGGGGGLYIRGKAAVTPGATYNMHVGAGGAGGTQGTPSNPSYENAKAGEATWFIDNNTLRADGGSDGKNMGGGNWGFYYACASPFTYITHKRGGKGYWYAYDYGNPDEALRKGGGGGSSGGTDANGNTATSFTGATAPTGGGNGGNGAETLAIGIGSPGIAPGGGGGGAYQGYYTGLSGGRGADGRIIISYTYGPNSITVTGFSPEEGMAGQEVTITGTGFAGVTSVTFNGAEAAYTVNGTTTITATVPSGASTGIIAVTTSCGYTGSSSSNFTVLKGAYEVMLSNFDNLPNPSIYFCFDNARINNSTPVFVATAKCTEPEFNRFMIEVNSATDFAAGTSFLQTFAGTYTSNGSYELNFSNATPAFTPTENGRVYYVRARASADGGATWSGWTKQRFSFTYDNSVIGTDWYQSNDYQWKDVDYSYTANVYINPADISYYSNDTNMIKYNSGFETAFGCSGLRYSFPFGTGLTCVNVGGALNTAYTDRVSNATAGVSLGGDYCFELQNRISLENSGSFTGYRLQENSNAEFSINFLNLINAKSLSFDYVYKNVNGGGGGGSAEDGKAALQVYIANSPGLTAEYTFPFYDFNNSSYSLAWSSSVYDARQDGSYIPTQPGKYTATIDLTTPTNYTAYENATIYFVNNTTAPSSSTKAMPTFYIDNLILESCTDGSGTYTSTPAYLGSFIGIRKWNTFIWTPFANDGNCFFSIEKSVAGTPDWQATTFTDIPATGDGFQSVDISSLGGGADVAQLRIKLKFVNCSGKPKVTSIGLTTCNPDITLEPIKDTTICEGNNIEIELHATGTELRYQWTKGGSDINGATTSILRINNITKKDEEVYSCRVSSGCTEKELEPFLLFVNQKAYINTLPLILLKNAGENLTFTLSPQGTPPFEYQWKKGNENIEGATNNKLTLNSVTCEDAAKYKCEINNLCGTSIAEAGTLIVRGCGEGTISGIVTYDNNSQTPMAGTKVYLETEEGYKIDSVITDDTGYYKFDYLANGNYRVESGVEKSWGGVDPVDALMVNRYFIGLYNFTSPMRARAADVSGDKKVNPLDALLINRRFVGLITHFNIPDWLTESYDITVSGDNITRDILTICAGDANGSYTPHKKVMHTIAGTRENEELQMEKGRIIDIPVYIEYNDIIGALGLKLKLRGREFEVIDVKSGIDGIIKNTYTTEGIEHVNVAWSAIEEGYRVTSGKAVIILKVRSKGEGKNKGEGWLEVSSESVIADYEGNIISTELLKVPKLIYGGNATGGGIHIYPNPFSGITNIEYRLEEEAEVKVNIYNLLGEKVMERGAGRQQEGLQRLVMDCTMLREGIYYCEMEITNREKQVTKKSVMVVSRGY